MRGEKQAPLKGAQADFLPFPLTAWVDAQEILRPARNECEDLDRIEFVRGIEHASENALVAS
jgi:hypothetical protein